MRRILISASVLLAVGAVLVIATGATNSNSAAGTYKIELDNAFGLVTGADFKVAGVSAGTIESIDLDQKTLHAIVTVHVTQPGFGSFHADAFCQSRPQSLIGEYFVECQPGSAGKVLKAGSTIPVTHTQTTIPADLLQDVMRMPYRERFSLIINELGAGVAGTLGRSAGGAGAGGPGADPDRQSAQSAGRRLADAAALTANSDAVITALADNSTQVQRFIDEADRAATDTATQQSNLQASFHRLPGFLSSCARRCKSSGPRPTPTCRCSRI